jgi:4-nitrophenyl phosphatase
VIWRGYQPIIDIKALFDAIHANGATAFCITNNSTQTVENYYKKLAEFQVSLPPGHIVSGAVASADYLKKNIPPGGSFFLVGEDGLRETIQKAGFQSVPDDSKAVDAVVVGLDFQINYAKIAQAANLIRDGALFIGTNPDQTFPGPGGLFPGAGTFVTAVQSASGKEPLMMGKPEPYLYQLALERAGSEPEDALMIGDRLETDILGAQRLGIPTAVVLTGVVDRAAADQWYPAPEIIAENALDVIEELTG